MSRFAAGGSQHPDSPVAIGEAIGQVLEGLDGRHPTLAALFFSDHHIPELREIVDTCHEVLRPETLIGASAQGVVAGSTEMEAGPCLSLFALYEPEARIEPLLLETISAGEDLAVMGWPKWDGGPATMILLADPFSFPVGALLDYLNAYAPDVKAVGGMASAASAPRQNRLLLDRTVTTEGAVGAIVAGIPVEPLVSQGCSPIGRPLIVTKAESNVVYELAGKPATERLREALAETTDNARLALRGLHIGIVVDERQTDFERGDFVIRNVIAADQDSGAIALGDEVEVGRTVQFHVRDAEASHEELVSMLSGKQADAALLFTCNGRGASFFGTPHHDASVVSESLGQVPVAGFFCAGEIGPVGTKNFLHGFTASLALFRRRGS